MFNKEFKLLLIKIATIIVSAVGFSLVSAWVVHTPASERNPDVADASFSYAFATNFVLSFFVFLALAFLSPLADKIVVEKFRADGIKGILIFASAYILLGIAGGVVVSFLFLQPGAVIYFIRLSVMCAVIFFFVQTLIQLLVLKATKKKAVY